MLACFKCIKNKSLAVSSIQLKLCCIVFFTESTMLISPKNSFNCVFTIDNLRKTEGYAAFEKIQKINCVAKRLALTSFLIGKYRNNL